jgi:hypothetical protein
MSRNLLALPDAAGAPVATERTSPPSIQRGHGHLRLRRSRELADITPERSCGVRSRARWYNLDTNRATRHKQATSRPRPLSEGKAPDGAALENERTTLARRFEPGRHTTLTYPRIVCVYAGRRHGPMRSSGRISDGSPYGLRWRRGVCVPFGRMCDSQRYWVVPASRLSPSATEGAPPSVAHGRDIDNFLSIGVPQAPSNVHTGV